MALRYLAGSLSPIKTKATKMNKEQNITPSDAFTKLMVSDGWIDVNEKKPNDKDKVLVSCEHGVTMAEYTKFDNGNEMWWAVLCIGTYEDSGDAKHVTHWMPLPLPPICT